VARRSDPIQSEAMRRRIVTAAAEAFAEKGYGGARVDEIARRAGINKATLYYHVGDKRALYEAVLLHFLSGAWREIEASIRACRTGPERLKALAGAVSAMAASSPQFPRLMLRELAAGGADLPEPVLRGMARIAQVTGRILEEGHDEGTIRRTDPLMVHLALVGATMALTVSAPVRKKIRARGIQVVPGMEFTEAISDFLGTLFVSGLRSDGAATARRGRQAASGRERSHMEASQ